MLITISVFAIFAIFAIVLSSDAFMFLKTAGFGLFQPCVADKIPLTELTEAVL